ncbi:hypothetical protein ARALYDRAFT_330849 [Arabidopsis lyrata subsp. lyrata]|uniref:F-box domain-containing protein n=1 Tax=Arabidopsis lyrata subsp. lyrata TaxID=81972 RepID=D7MTD5_ARALL|nr:hypothetical protein ARALYDRAFT_330849 [Arabidopsis lyrata subsp. lyrata]
MTSLPDDIIVDIIARVPRTCYPTISLISRRFRSIIASPELYTRRSLLRCTEHCLYALIYNPKNGHYHWYILRRRKGFILIPSLPIMHTHGNSVALGSKIYVYSNRVTSSVLTIDCTSNTVQPSFNIPKAMGETVAGIIDGKIYVIGELAPLRLRVMVLNTEKQMWETAEMTKPPGLKTGHLWSGCVVMEGKIYMRDLDNSFVYVPKEKKWEMEEMLNSHKWKYACVLDDVLYYYDCLENRLRAYDTKHKFWVVVKGGERLLSETSWLRLPTISRWAYTMSCGEKLVVFFPKLDIYSTKIWCAEIALERRQGGEIWGKFEWCGAVLDSDC